MGRLDFAASTRLIDVAFDAGITHFDTARAYGYGEAERALAPLLARHRSAVTVTTKAGILPPGRSALVSGLRNIARRAVAVAPGLRKLLRRGAAATVIQGRFDVETLRASFETSLKELASGDVDCLLLHECGLGDLEDEAVQAFLDAEKRKGRVRWVGTATGADETQRCLAVAGPLDIVQFPSDANNRNARRIAAPDGTRMITHSAVGAGVRRLAGQLARDQDERRRWSAALDIDADDPRALGLVLLRHALDANPGGTVLFSSTDPDTIRKSARLLSDDLVTAGQARALEGLIGRNDQLDR